MSSEDNQKIELKPCPFCGAPGKEFDDQSSDYQRHWYKYFSCSNGECPCDFRGSADEWNKRIGKIMTEEEELKCRNAQGKVEQLESEVAWLRAMVEKLLQAHPKLAAPVTVTLPPPVSPQSEAFRPFGTYVNWRASNIAPKESLSVGDNVAPLTVGANVTPLTFDSPFSPNDPSND